MKTQRPRKAVYATLPDWVKPAQPDVAGFFSALALADLEGGYIRLRAADQRALLGCVPFGACALMSLGNSVRLVRSVCFGTDCEAMTFTASELSDRIKAGETARPGVYGALTQ